MNSFSNVVAITMNITAWVIIVLAIGLVVGGVLVLKKSNKKFQLSDDQLKDIKKRNKAWDEQDRK